MNKFIISATLLLFTSGAWATDFGKCNTMFPQNTPPKVSKSATKPLCFDSFAVLYSVETKTPVYVVEKLNYLRLGSKEPRTNHFHEEPMLSLSERSTLKDYNHSGYDRGHMAPAADMPNSLAMEQSFSLANMVPQSSKLNRGIWAKSVEKPTREYVKKRSKGDVYVFTGPVYNGSVKTVGPNRVRVPDYVFKLVYDSGTGKSWVFYLENKDEVRMSAPITYEEFVKKTGLNLLNK
jgi:endonuclease G